MPDGRVQRIDEERDTAYIIRSRRLYPALISELEIKARVAGARVRFDVARQNGVESATNVRLRHGTRTGRRQRRFGDLTGAKRPGAKITTASADRYGVDVTTQPTKVAETWLKALAGNDLDGALNLYLPDAVLHTSGGTFTGRRALAAQIETADLPHLVSAETTVSAHDQNIHIRAGGRRSSGDVWFTVRKGSIAEQWIGVRPGQSDRPSPDVDDVAEHPMVRLVTGADVPGEAASYARAKMGKVLERVGRRVLFAQVKLSGEQLGGGAPTMVAETTVEWPRMLLRAHADGSSYTEAIDSAMARLTTRLDHRTHDNRTHSDTIRVPDAWQRPGLTNRTSRRLDSAEQERILVRHKSFSPEEVTVDEAAWDMLLLDYDFFLFTDLATGQDSLLERTDEGLLTLRNQTGTSDEPPSPVNDVKFIDRSAPYQTVSEAIDLLDQAGLPRLFFTNTTTDRGNVLYHRLDGNYGLITPANDDSDL